MDKQTQLIAIVVLAFHAFLGVFAEVGTAHLEQKGREHCKEQRWASEEHWDHVNFCTTNGYPVR